MNYNDIMKMPGRKIKPKVYYYEGSNKIELLKDDIILAKPFFYASLVGTIMKGLELELTSVLPNKPIYFENTAKYGSNSATKTIGPYYLKEEPTFNADSKTYTHKLYDNFIKSMVPYKPITITYPCSLIDFFKRLCIECNFTTNITSLPNGQRIIDHDIYDGLDFTYRDVFEDIGQATATLFKNNSGNVEKCSLGTSNIVINDDILRNQNISLGEHFGPINSIVLSRAGESDSIYKRDESLTTWNEFKIVDNILMNDNNRSDYLDELYTALSGLEYDIFDLELVGFGGFEPLQKISIKTNNKTYNSYVFNNEEKYTQGYEESIYNELPAETVTDYNASDKTDRRINQVYIIANKQEKRIDAVVSEQKQIEKDITTSKTAEGNPIEVTDAGEYNLESIEIDGKSFQKTYKGNQLIDLTNMIANANTSYTFEKNTIIENCTNQTYSTIYYDITETLKNNKGKKLYFNCESYDFSKGNKPNVSLQINRKNEDGTNSVSYATLFDYLGNKTSYTIPSDFDNIVYIRFRFICNNTSTAGNFSAKWVKPILSFGENAPYEPYVGTSPSPSVDFPQEIKTVHGDNEFLRLKSCGKNLLNLNENEYNKYINSLGVISEGNNGNNVLFAYIPVLQGKTICYSANKNCGLHLNLYDENHNFIKRLVTDFFSNKLIYEIEDNVRFLRAVANYDNSTSMTNEFIQSLELQIEYSKDRSSYENYKENVALIDIRKKNLANIEEIQIGKQWDGNTNPNRASILNIAVKANTQYTLAGDISPNPNLTSLRCVLYDSSKKVNLASNTFTTLSSTIGLSIEVLSDKAITKDMLKNIKVNLYEGVSPYHEIVNIGKVSDSFVSGSLIKRIKKYVINGTENFIKYYNENYQGKKYDFVYFPLDELHTQNADPNQIFIISSKFKGKTVNTLMDENDTISTWNGTNSCCIHSSKFSTVEEAKNFFRDNPTEIYYVLANQQVYELDSQVLKLHKGYNYITLKDNLLPNMRIKYLTDSKFNADYATKSEITMKSNEIMIDVNGKLENYSTTTETNALIDAKVEEESASINLSVSQKIEDIKIGGTNLAIDTNNGIAGWLWHLGSTGASVIKEEVIENDIKCCKLTRNTVENTSYSYIGYLNINRQKYLPNRQYTISFEIKASVSTSFKISLRSSNNQNPLTAEKTTEIVAANKWTKSSVTLTTLSSFPEATNQILYIRNMDSNIGTTYVFRHLKIEEGNKATDWSPAPEDMATNSNVEAKLELYVGKDENDQVISMVNASADEIVLKSNRFSLISTQCEITKQGSITVYDDINNNASFMVKNKKNNDISKIWSGTAMFQRKYGNDTMWVDILQQADGIGERWYGDLIVASKTGNNDDSYRGLILNPNEIRFSGASTLIDRNNAWIRNRPVITGTYGDNRDVSSLAILKGTKTYLEVTTIGLGAYGVDAWASDKRLKRRIKDSKYNALDTLMKIKHRQFIYRKSNEKILIGYIADELQEIDENLIFEVGPQKIKQPSQSYIIPILSKAIQEQQELISNQEERIKELENKVNKLLEIIEGKKEI